MWFDESLHVQTLPRDLTNIFNENGWENFLKYRYRYGDISGDGFTYVDVRLYRSIGSDKKRRQFGIAFGYDTANTLFSDGRIISDDSPLGYLGMGDGEKAAFKSEVQPIDEDEIEVYIDGLQVNDSRYDVNPRDGVITFLTAPKEGSDVTMSYKLAKTAPEPPPYLIFFTFGGVSLSRLIGADAPVKIADGDGVRKEFQTPTAPIKHKSMYLYIDGDLIDPKDEEFGYELDLEDGKIIFKNAPELGKEITVRYTTVESGTSKSNAGDGDGETTEFFTPSAPIGKKGLKVYDNGELQTPESYEVDYEKGLVTFKEAPVLGAEITIEYIDLTGGAPGGITEITNDIPAIHKIDVSSPLGVMDAVYQSLDYITPSLPTVVDFTSEKSFSTAWQRDSFVHVWGDINKNRCAMFARPDPGGDPTTALFAPVYFGKLHTPYLHKPRTNMVIASGCTEQREIKYKPGIEIGNIPVDFGAKTSNGNRGVMVSQARGGAYYQQYYLKFITHSKHADNGDGQFHPSRYSEKYHVSAIKVTHPNDGDVGYLDDMLAVLPKGIFAGDELEVESTSYGETLGFGDGRNRSFSLKYPAFQNTIDDIKVGCETTGDDDYTYDSATKTVTFNEPPKAGEEVIASYEYSLEYQFDLPTTDISPFTLEEFTPFTPIGLAILKNPQKDKKRPKPNEEGEKPEPTDPETEEDK